MRTVLALASLILLVSLSCGDDIANGGRARPDPDPDPDPTPEVGDLTVDSSVRFQTMKGWEAVAQAGHADDHIRPSFPLFRDEVFDAAAFDLGITRFRVSAYTGMENPRDAFTEWQTGLLPYSAYSRCERVTTYNDNDDPNVIDWSGFNFSVLDHTIDNVILPMKQRLASRGEALYFTLDYVAPAANCLSVPELHSRSPAEYAEFILANFLHMQQKYGFVPDAVEIINEPDARSIWQSGVTIGQSLVAAGDLLAANGFTPDYIAPSTVSVALAATYFDAMSLVPRALEYLTELSYHRYRDASPANVQKVADRARQFNLQTGMLEHIGSGHEDLHEDLTVGMNSSWEQFALAYGGSGGGTNDPGGAYYRVSVSDPANPVVQMGTRTRMLRQYFKWVRPGAVRVAVTSKNAAFDPVAFLNTDGRQVVVVKASSGGSFTVAGLPPATYGITYTTEDAYDVSHPDVTLTSGKAIATSIPDQGVLTIYAK